MKFGGEFSFDSDTEDEREERSKELSIASTPTLQHKPSSVADLSLRPARPPARTFSSSAATLVDRGGKGLPDHILATLDYDKEIEAVKDKLRRNGADGIGSKEEVEYSDYEEEDDIAKGPPTRANDSGGDRGEQPWSPGFLRRHQSQAQARSQSQGHALVPPPARVDLPSGVMPVPATPSLIKAIDRIALAQRDAFGVPNNNSPASKGHQLPRLDLEPLQQSTTREEAREGVRGDVDGAVTEKTPRWEEFWREVGRKARS